MGLNEDFQNLSPWLDKLSFNWSYLEQYGKTIHLKKDENLFHNGDELSSIFLVKKGRIRLYLITVGGKEKTINVIGQNGIIGDHFLSGTTAHITNAIAVSDSTLIEISKELFERLTLEDKEFTKQWIKILSMKLELLTTTTFQLTFDSSIQRILNTFIQLSEVYGVPEENGSIKILIKFTHQELADLIGTTRVTVSNTVKKLFDDELIYKKNGFYYIDDMERLRDVYEKFSVE